MDEKKQKESSDKEEGRLISEEEIKETVMKIQKFHEELDQQIDNVYKISGLTREQILDYLANKENFTETEWKQIQSLRKQYDSKLQSQLTKDYQDIQKGKKRAKSKQKLKGKRIGMKKKWIEMD